MIDTFLISLFAGLMIIAGTGDALSYRIPNRLVLLIAALFLPAALAAGLSWAELGIHLGIGLATLLVAFVLFNLGLFGGGDAKLIAAASLWLGWPALVPFLVWTAMAGGLLGILFGLRMLIDRFVRKVSSKRDIPYGIALAVGAIIALPQSWMLAP